ncbi:hypothetical protein D9M72_609820 [compost metagenome]
MQLGFSQGHGAWDSRGIPVCNGPSQYFSRKGTFQCRVGRVPQSPQCPQQQRACLFTLQGGGAVGFAQFMPVGLDYQRYVQVARLA